MVKYKTSPQFPKVRIGDDGTVWRRFNFGWRQCGLEGKDRGRVSLRDVVGVTHKHRVVIWVMLAFNGPPPDDGYQYAVGYRNGDKRDCRSENLYWTRDRATSYARGERHGRSVLGRVDVLRIKRKLRAGKTAYRVAREEGVAPTTVYDIKDGATWAWLGE